MPLQVIGRMVLDRWPDNFFAETEQVAFCPAQHRARHRLHATIRCCRAGCSPTSTRSSRGSARPTSTRSRSTRRSARSPTSSATATCRCSMPKGRVDYEPSSLAGATRPRETPGARLSQLRRAGRRRRRKGRIRAESFADHYSQARLFYPQPDRARAGAHRLGAGVRAVEGRDARTCARRWSATCATSTTTSPSASPTAWAWTRCRQPPTPAAPVHRHAAVAGAADHRQDEGHARGPRGRHPGRRRLRRRHASRRCARPSTTPARRVKIVAPKVGGVKLAGRLDAARRRPARRHAVGAVRRGRAGALGRRRRQRCRRRPPRSTSCAMPSATSRRSPSTTAARPCCKRPASTPDDGVVSAHDSPAFIAAAKTRQWNREPGVRTLA